MFNDCETKNLFLCRDLFATADTNEDGKMTFAEWRDSMMHSTHHDENNATLFKHWIKYDIENVGYLTKEEAINRKA
jgi:Ca2+-binding EF-hand superfamily protein